MGEAPAARADSSIQTVLGNFVPAPCSIGIYRANPREFVAITRSGDGFSYAFSDGEIGDVDAADLRLSCGEGHVRVDGSDLWPKVPISETSTRFRSGDIELAGLLLEPPGADGETPLVVYAHGSEPTGWIERFRDPYQMVGRGISVFVYDKRGTGQSQGRYTQNFPRLAEDLVAASAEAKRLAQGRFGRFGLIGLSQGGWIAPLASDRAGAEFIGIGYGLVADIREEDAAQVQKELREAGYGRNVLSIAREITDVTARIAQSDYTDGLEELTQIQQKYGDEEWFPLIRGGYSGVFLAMSATGLSENGVPRFNDLDIDWTLDPVRVLSGVDVPQLWVLAEDDREAPIELSLDRLLSLKGRGQEIKLIAFPDTDHGIWEFDQAADGSREYLRVSEGYYDLMADWAKGRVSGSYGKSVAVEDRSMSGTAIGQQRPHF